MFYTKHNFHQGAWKLFLLHLFALMLLGASRKHAHQMSIRSQR